jgi:hypothetical protein
VDWIDKDLACSEAYQHGRTQSKLKVARLALLQIATSKARNLNAIRAVAKLALEMSAEDVEDKQNDTGRATANQRS